MSDVSLEADESRRFATDLLRAWGTPEGAAAEVADHLVLADLSGHASHGISRLPWYRRYVNEGVVQPAQIPSIENTDLTRHGVAVVSANWGFSQPAGNLATDLAVERALLNGVGAAAVVRCAHMGRMGTYVERAAAAGCAAIATVGGMRGAGVTVPFGGAKPLLGPSPYSMGFPTMTDSPVLMDISTTEIPLGKVMIAKSAGRRLPVAGLVEADGSLTDDPSALDRGGALATFGGHKGFGLATMADLFGGTLTGAFEYASEGFGGPAFRSAGMLVIAVAADAFAPSSAVTHRASQLQAEIRDVPPAAGVTAVLAPGDPEASARQSAKGRIALPEALWNEIVELAIHGEVTPPETREVVA